MTTQEISIATIEPKIAKRLTAKRSGLNLIEIAIVLAVIGLVIGGIYVAAAAVYENNRTQTAQKQLLQMVQGIRAAVNASGVSTGISNATAIQLGAVPRDMITDQTAGTIVDPWGGAVTISSPNAPTFQIQMASVSQSACSDLLMKLAPTSESAAAIGLNTVTGIASAYAPPASSANIGTVTTACANPTGGVMTFVFNVR